MQLETKSLRKTINKAFLKETVDRSSFNKFKVELGQLLDKIESAKKKGELEEHYKKPLNTFFEEVGFTDYNINTSNRIDLAIYTEGNVGVLFEVKSPTQKQDMITEADFNRKALQQAVLYYLEQRIEEENEDLKHVVITDTLNWFVFDAQEFERCFYRPSALIKTYKSWKTDQKVSSNKDFMYDKIADFINSQDTTLRGLHLDLKSFEQYLKAKEDSEPEKKLIPLFKFFSPTQLLKEPFANDSNTLNREFYRELLYILGLEETTKGNTRYIERASEENRHAGSFIENTIRILDAEDHLSTVREPKVKYGADHDEQLFNVALELSIIWMNRVLFLKLLEAQLFRYHRQDKKFKFLKSKTIDGYDELNKLFFQVLARQETDRTDDINEKFGHIPYLNSSLFDPSSLEHQSVFTSNLDDKKTLPVYSRSVLKDRRGDEINTLEYLFEFLDAYDFAAEGGEEIQEERKTLINASVLGLIFEKINGYKDGSFFTPGFITEYMARETLRKAITDKFAQHWNAEDLSFEDIYNRIGRGDTDIEKANEIVNNITICDPAVGSGHFLVSCLNELLAIKSDLGILSDQEGKLLRDINVEVENDELIVTYSDEELFEYDVAHTWHGSHLANRKISGNRQRIQKALFHEKRHIIENCLFGVDINSNSVKICRLRLWIELLKNTYYTERSNYRELEVLPNIDINIKTGNSLVSRFDLDSDLSSVFKGSDHSLEDYKEAVRSYKHTGDREEKHRLQQLIDDIKEDFAASLEELHPERKKLKELKAKLIKVKTQKDIFGDDIEEGGSRSMRIKTLEKKITNQKKVVDDLEAGKFYNQAFEWRFEFPEVLNEDGQFIGFDIVIGNPPYGRYNVFTKEERNYLKNREIYGRTGDIAEVFIRLVLEALSKNQTQFSFIVPKGVSYVKSWGSIRDKLNNETQIHSVVDTSRAFKEALYEMLIFHVRTEHRSTTKIKTGYLSDANKNLFHIPASRYSKRIFYLGFPKEYFPILEKINDNSSPLSNHYKYWYGKGGMTPKTNEKGKGLKVLTGKEVQRYYFKDIDEKWYLEEEYLDNSKIQRAQQKKVVAQDIVAHLKNPVPHIKLTANLDKLGQVCLNTVMCFAEKKDGFTNEFLLALINSKLMSFYFYYFIFNQAIRTMHFMPGYADRLPIHKSSESFHQKIQDKANMVLRKKEEYSKADTSELEEEIDQLVYKLYGLSKEEIEIVEGSGKKMRE